MNIIRPAEPEKLRAELALAKEDNLRVNVKQLATKYHVPYQQATKIYKELNAETTEKAIHKLVETPQELVVEIAQEVQARYPDKPTEELFGEVDYLTKSTEGLKKLKYEVQAIAQKAVMKLDSALDNDEYQDPRNLKYLVDSIAAINSSFFKDTSTNVIVNNQTNNHLALFRENMGL